MYSNNCQSDVRKEEGIGCEGSMHGSNQHEILFETPKIRKRTAIASTIRR
jgi:hypothetical protein